MSELLTVTRAAGALGAYVSGVDLADIVASVDLFTKVRALAVDHEALFLRDQNVAAPVFQAFAENFGEVLEHPAYATAADAPKVQILESTAEAPSKIEVWHSDMTFGAMPPSFTLLHGQVIPAYGGDTLFSGRPL